MITAPIILREKKKTMVGHSQGAHGFKVWAFGG